MKRFSYYGHLVTSLLCALTLSLTVTAVESGDDIYSLSLESLLNIKVTTASKQNESIFEAPGIITTWTNKDIKLLGYYNLADLANITPGWSSYTDIGENTFVTRGQKASGFDNNRHLVLLDGIPINHARADTAHADNQLPLYFADKIEFLRGPASALYGVSAFYGVINIHPLERKNKIGSETEFQLSVGNENAARRVMGNYLSSSENGHGGVRLAYYTRDASADYVGLVQDNSHLNYDDQQSRFAYGSWAWTDGALAGIKLGAIHLNKQGGLGNFWADYSDERNEIEWNTDILYAKYQSAITQNVSVNSYLKYNQSSEAATYYDNSGLLQSRYDYPFQNYEGQLEFAWALKENQDLIFGLNQDRRYGEAQDVLVNNTIRTTPRTPTLVTSSAWLQYQGDFNFFNTSSLTLGLRNDDAEAASEQYTKVSPRAALVQGLSERVNIKFLYGEALRGPSVKEIGVNDEVRIENPLAVLGRLKPEEIETYEVSPFYQHKDLLASLTFFKTKTSNFIGRDWNNLGEYINVDGEIESSGYELELNYLLSRDVKLFINFSHAESKTEDQMTLSDLPGDNANFGILWDSLNKVPFKGSLVFRWQDGFTSSQNEFGVEGYSVVDLNLEYTFNSGMTAGIQCRNLLDENYYMPLNGEPATRMPGSELVFTLSASH